jgi:hypothetical protein
MTAHAYLAKPTRLQELKDVLEKESLSNGAEPIPIPSAPSLNDAELTVFE